MTSNNEKKVSITFKCEKEFKETLEKLAKEEERTISNFIIYHMKQVIKEKSDK